MDALHCIIPPFLQVPYEICTGLVQRAYHLEDFPLRMIHLATALIFEIMTLAKALEHVHNGADPQQKRFAKGDPLVDSNLIQVASSMVDDFYE